MSTPAQVAQISLQGVDMSAIAQVGQIGDLEVLKSIPA